MSEELCKFCTGVHFSIAKTNLTIYRYSLNTEFTSRMHAKVDMRRKRFEQLATQINDERSSGRAAELVLFIWDFKFEILEYRYELRVWQAIRNAITRSHSLIDSLFQFRRVRL
ncbi:unnamed protein product [Nesidiocoris tenuis]|uniref:Uncharacterized protein n=1 Tax=Nesidiocoris tenuis TaxID=355587 RepID=A0A6H5H631_9HEMI|nr:unnamed protein product [Nesidiocoris tenuis]